MKVKERSQGQLVSELVDASQRMAHEDFSSIALACLPQPVPVLNSDGKVKYVNRVEEHGGSVEVERVVGQGAASLCGCRWVHGVQSRMVRNPRVLIADGDVGLCGLMSIVLRRTGYSVAIAEDGPSAAAAAKETSFDIILLEIRSPVMSGVKTYKALRQMRPEAAVVMMTAFTVGGLAQDVLGEVPCAVIYKPVEIDRLMEAIDGARSADRGGLVLVVDDDPGAHATLGDTLAGRGYRLTEVRSGQEAVARANEASGAVLFVINKVAPVNALETYLAVREANPHAVAVVMTSCRLRAAQVAEQALRGDVYPCLHKPFSLEELLTLSVEVEQGRLRAG